MCEPDPPRAAEDEQPTGCNGSREPCKTRKDTRKIRTVGKSEKNYSKLKHKSSQFVCTDFSSVEGCTEED